MRTLYIAFVAALFAVHTAAQQQQIRLPPLRPNLPLPVNRPLLPQGRVIGANYRLPNGQLYSPDHFYNRGADGQSFTSGYTSPDGTQVYHQGDIVPTLDGQDGVIVNRGGYSYISPEGTQIVVRYIADHNGFRVIPNDARAPQV